MIKKIVIGELSHKKLFAVLLWIASIAMIIVTFTWSLFSPVGDPGMIDKLIWSTLGGGAFLSGVDVYDEYKKFRGNQKND
jgi:hypothetical protein